MSAAALIRSLEQTTCAYATYYVFLEDEVGVGGQCPELKKIQITREKPVTHNPAQRIVKSSAMQTTTTTTGFTDTKCSVCFDISQSVMPANVVS